MSKWYSRKLWFALFVVITATAMLWFGRLNGAEWIEVMKWVGGVYLISNAVTHYAHKVIEKK